MGYIAVISAIVGLFFAFEKFTQMTMKKRVILFTVVLIITGSLYSYEMYNDALRERKNEIVYHFEHNVTVVCGEINVTSQMFNYSPNGHSFIGKVQSPFDGLILSVYECN